jgi:hypothetical protein
MADYLSKYFAMFDFATQPPALQIRLLLDTFSDYAQSTKTDYDPNHLQGLAQWQGVAASALVQSVPPLDRLRRPTALADLTENLIPYPAEPLSPAADAAAAEWRLPESVMNLLGYLQEVVHSHNYRHTIDGALPRLFQLSQSDATIQAVTDILSADSPHPAHPAEQPVYPQIAPLSALGKRPFWSVIILTRDRVDFIEAALSSILAQAPARDEMEIHVLNDGAPTSIQDQIEAMVGAFHDERIQFYRHPQMVGRAHLSNLGVQRSTGQWIHILPDDAVVLPGFYRQMRQGLATYPRAHGLVSRL